MPAGDLDGVENDLSHLVRESGQIRPAELLEIGWPVGLKLAQTLERMQRYRDALTVYEELAEVGDETRALEAMGRIAALREKLRE